MNGPYTRICIINQSMNFDDSTYYYDYNEDLMLMSDNYFTLVDMLMYYHDYRINLTPLIETV